MSRVLARLIALLCLFGAAPITRAATATATIEARVAAQTLAAPAIGTRSARDRVRAVVVCDAAVTPAPRKKLYLTQRALLI